MCSPIKSFLSFFWFFSLICRFDLKVSRGNKRACSFLPAAFVLFSLSHISTSVFVQCQAGLCRTVAAKGWKSSHRCHIRLSAITTRCVSTQLADHSTRRAASPAVSSEATSDVLPPTAGPPYRLGSPLTRSFSSLPFALEISELTVTLDRTQGVRLQNPWSILVTILLSILHSTQRFFLLKVS